MLDEVLYGSRYTVGEGPIMRRDPWITLAKLQYLVYLPYGKDFLSFTIACVRGRCRVIATAASRPSNASAGSTGPSPEPADAPASSAGRTGTGSSGRSSTGSSRSVPPDSALTSTDARQQLELAMCSGTREAAERYLHHIRQAEQAKTELDLAIQGQWVPTAATILIPDRVEVRRKAKAILPQIFTNSEHVMVRVAQQRFTREGKELAVLAKWLKNEVTSAIKKVEDLGKQSEAIYTVACAKAEKAADHYQIVQTAIANQKIRRSRS